MVMFIDRHAKATYQWMNLVVHKNVTFADVDDDTVHSAIKYDSMCSKTLGARMMAAVTVIEPTIAAELTDDKFVMVFDGVTDAWEHSLVVFAVMEGWTVLGSVVIP
ncbi:hypothetical protein PRIC2_004343 [Phytophthora ramorum]